MVIYVKKTYFISIFAPFFWFYNMILSDAVDFTHIAASEQVMTSQIRSHIEYLTHTYYILVLIL